MDDQLGNDDHVPGLGVEIGHALGDFGRVVGVVVRAILIAARVEHFQRAGEVGLVRAGQDDETAVARLYIRQVKEKDQVIAGNAAVVDLVATPARHGSPQRTLVARMQGVKGFAVEIDHHIAAAEPRSIIEQFFDDRPSHRVHGQGFKGFVKGKGVQIPVEVVALKIDRKAVGHLLGGGVDIALRRLLGLL